MPKHKPRPRPEPADAWTWLYRLTAAEGIDLQHTSLAEAADCVVSRLEAQRDAGLSLSPETVRLAALLVRVEAEVIASGASSPEPFLQHAHLRAWTRLLAERYAANRRVWSRPPIQKPRPQPKPQPEPMVTVFDLVQQMRFVVQAIRAAPARQRGQALSRQRAHCLARIGRPFTAHNRFPVALIPV